MRTIAEINAEITELLCRITDLKREREEVAEYYSEAGCEDIIPIPPVTEAAK